MVFPCFSYLVTLFRSLFHMGIQIFFAQLFYWFFRWLNQLFVVYFRMNHKFCTQHRNLCFDRISWLNSFKFWFFSVVELKFCIMGFFLHSFLMAWILTHTKIYFLIVLIWLLGGFLRGGIIDATLTYAFSIIYISVIVFFSFSKDNYT